MKTIDLKSPVCKYTSDELIKAFEDSKYFYQDSHFNYKQAIKLLHATHDGFGDDFDISNIPVEEFLNSVGYYGCVWVLLSKIYENMYLASPPSRFELMEISSICTAIKEIPSLYDGSSATEFMYTSWVQDITDNMFKTLKLNYKSSGGLIGECIAAQFIFESQDKRLQFTKSYIIIDLVISYEDIYDAAIKRKPIKSIPVLDYTVKQVAFNPNDLSNPVEFLRDTNYTSRSLTLGQFNIKKQISSTW